MTKLKKFYQLKFFNSISVGAFFIVFLLLGCRDTKITYSETTYPTSILVTNSSTQQKETKSFNLFEKFVQPEIQLTLGPEIKRSNIVRLNIDTLKKITTTLNEPGKTISIKLELFDDVIYFAHLSLSSNTKIDDSIIFEGFLDDVTNSQVLFVLDKNNCLVGKITFPGNIYQISIYRDSLYRISQIDQKKFPNPEEPSIQ